MPVRSGREEIERDHDYLTPSIVYYKQLAFLNDSGKVVRREGDHFAQMITYQPTDYSMIVYFAEKNREGGDRLQKAAESAGANVTVNSSRDIPFLSDGGTIGSYYGFTVNIRTKGEKGLRTLLSNPEVKECLPCERMLQALDECRSRPNRSISTG